MIPSHCCPLYTAGWTAKCCHKPAAQWRWRHSLFLLIPYNHFDRLLHFQLPQKKRTQSYIPVFLLKQPNNTDSDNLDRLLSCNEQHKRIRTVLYYLDWTVKSFHSKAVCACEPTPMRADWHSSNMFMEKRSIEISRKKWTSWGTECGALSSRAELQSITSRLKS